MITKSQRCRYEDFEQLWFKARKEEIKKAARTIDKICLVHRKLWEFCIMMQVMKENPGQYAIGFGCGIDPIARWLRTQNYQEVISSDIEPKILGDIKIDMRDISKEFRQRQFDIVWSSCALEHLGSRQAGIKFIFDSLECLKSGGLAIHTTEFNFDPSIKSNKVEFGFEFDTLDAKDLCLYTEENLNAIDFALFAYGHKLWDLDLRQGNRPEDEYIDPHPYYSKGVHINLEVNKQYVTTSVLLIIRKG